MCLAQVLVFGDGMSLGNEKDRKRIQDYEIPQWYEVFAAAHPCIH